MYEMQVIHFKIQMFYILKIQFLLSKIQTYCLSTEMFLIPILFSFIKQDMFKC